MGLKGGGTEDARRSAAALSIPVDLLHCSAAPGSAACRLRHRGKRHLYSIPSSVRASTVAGMSMRSDFAVLRLIRRSNFVGSTTGNYDGFSPFTIRPA